MLKNPERGSQVVTIGKIEFHHARPITIDREEKKILKGTYGFIEFMGANVEKFDDEDLDNLVIIYKEAGKVRSELSDKMLTGKKMNNIIETFKKGRRDSKKWAEAADFLETYFDESNRVIIK